MISKAASTFWHRYNSLPTNIQELAQKNFRLWMNNPHHPSLRFKSFRGETWSVRVGEHYRAVGHFINDETFVWTWIGTHEEYNNL